MSANNTGHWKTNLEYIELMNFLIEKSKDAKPSLTLRQLAEEFKKDSGSSRDSFCLLFRILELKNTIHQMDSIDTAAKVKLLLVLRVPIDTSYLKELQKEADVEVDEYNRITKYRARNGSLNLEVNHSSSANAKEERKGRRVSKMNDDDSQAYMTKTLRSVKGAAVAEVPNPSKRAKDSSSAGSTSSENHAPEEDSARAPESGAEEPPNPGIQSPRQPLPETPRARTRQEAPVFRGAPTTPGDDIPQEKPIKTETGIDDGYTSRIKLLEAIQSLVLSLDMPSLSPLLTRIEKKLRELSSNDKIPNDEMAAALELFVVKITNDSVSNLPETVESVSLSHLLCYLKSLILNSKLEGLEGLLEKIKGKIRHPATVDKMIPVEKVMSTLQPILDVIGF